MLTEYNLEWNNPQTITDLLLLKDKELPKTVSSLPLKRIENDKLEQYRYGYFSTSKHCFAFVKNEPFVQIELPHEKYLTEYLNMLHDHFYCDFQHEIVEENNNITHVIKINSSNKLKNYYNFVMIRMFYSHIYMFIVDRLIYHYINIDKSIEPNFELTKELWEILILLTYQSQIFSDISKYDFIKISKDDLCDLFESGYNFNYLYYFGLFKMFNFFNNSYFFDFFNKKNNTYPVDLNKLSKLFKLNWDNDYVTLNQVFDLKNITQDGLFEFENEKLNKILVSEIMSRKKTSITIDYLYMILQNQGISITTANVLRLHNAYHINIGTTLVRQLSNNKIQVTISPAFKSKLKRTTTVTLLKNV